MPDGKIITFYSYKGGTGRSMALANVAWLLAMSGKRVITIDWDLEAPGLHRYFEPFIADKNLARSPGVIDFVLEFATAAVAGSSDNDSPNWYLPYANLIAYAVSVNWNFDGGCLDFVPAGRQDGGYPTRVNSFDWGQFYEKLGGGVLLETVKGRLRERYDYILIDSRTGVSDTAGVCTVQLPDELVVCFTLNRQSTLGASTAALSAVRQRQRPNSTFKVWPVPMRIETTSEKVRSERARALARIRFSGVLTHLSPQEEDAYWGDIEIPYFPFYAFDETLAIFADSPGLSSSFLTSMEKLGRRIAGESFTIRLIDSIAKEEGLRLFQRRSAFELLEELTILGEEYERIRVRMPDGSRDRTILMTNLVNRAQIIAGTKDAGPVAESLFRQGKDGSRLVGIALARKDPLRTHVEMALNGIASSRSAFEQYNALLLAQQLIPKLDPSAGASLISAINGQLGKTITNSDLSRQSLASAIVKSNEKLFRGTSPLPVPRYVENISGYAYSLFECRLSASFVRYEDPMEGHGQWVQTRGAHTLDVPSLFRIGEFLVTNSFYQGFVLARGYSNPVYWDPQSAPTKFVTADRTTSGPGSWPSSSGFPQGQENHPVAEVCHAEARAFVRWCNAVAPPADGWTWALPTEDIWELAARTESGLTYPWGDAFDSSHCNSAETDLRGTTPVDRYPSGASRIGCRDMAGNLWEFVESRDTPDDLSVMRGGSFTNNLYEVRSYLRLYGVPNTHRAPDFGFRLIQVQMPAPKP